jgi:hypothetical protein
MLKKREGLIPYHPNGVRHSHGHATDIVQARGGRIGYIGRLHHKSLCYAAPRFTL